MAETSYPFGSSSIATEDQWSSMFRMAQVDGVYAASEAGTDLKVTGSNAANVTVAAGEAWVQGTYYSNSANLTVAVPTNSGGGSARKDLVVLRRAPSSDVVSVVYRTGSTSYPSLTQTLNGTWEIPLARITVAAGASTVAPSDVQDVRWFNGRSPVLGTSTDTRPASRGQFQIRSGKDIYVGDGSAWNYLGTAEAPAAGTYTPVWDSGGTTINWGSGSTNIGRYKRISGNLYWVKIHLVPTGNPGAQPDPLRVTLPFPSQGSTRDMFTVHFTSTNGEGTGVGIGIVYPTEAANKICRIRFPESTGASGTPGVETINAVNMLNNEPFNVRTGDILTISGMYEIA